MDFLKNVVAAKSKEVKTFTGGNKKYFRKVDVEVAKEYAAVTENERRAAERRAREKRRLEELERQQRRGKWTRVRKRDPSETEDADQDAQGEKKEVVVSVEEVKRQLRLRLQPVTLFGETDSQRYRRLIDLGPADETLAEENKNVYAEAMLMAEEEVTKKVEEVETQVAAKWLEVPFHDLYQTIEDKSELISGVLHRLLWEWEMDLKGRSQSERRSAQGKHALAKFKQTRQSLSPFFIKLKDGTLPADMYDGVYNICIHLCKKEYIRANDVYLAIAIGKAAWPMGVTMVGIHERKARENVSEYKTAHVLDDETTRKYIQSLKRLMSYCQGRYALDDPSKMMG